MLRSAHLGLLLSLLFANAVRGGEAVRAAPEAGGVPSDELKQRISGHCGRLLCLKAWFRSWHRAHPEELTSGIVAAKGCARLNVLWHGDERDAENDRRAITTSYDGSSFNRYQHYERRIEVSKRFAVPPYITKIQTHFLFECLGWWPPGDVSPRPRRSDGEPLLLLDVLADARLQMAPGVVVIRDVKAHILEIPEVMRLWVDPDRGLIYRREEIMRGEDGVLSTAAVYEMTDFQEYADDIWLPRRISRTFPVMGMSTEHVIERYETNSVDDSTFSIALPPGTLVYDRDTDTEHQVPGGREWLDVVARRVISESRSPVLSTDGGRWDGWKLAAYFIFGSLVQIALPRLWRVVDCGARSVRN